MFAQCGVNVMIAVFLPRSNPSMIVSYSTSVVKIYNAANSLLRFEHKNIFLYFENSLAYYVCTFKPGVVIVVLPTIDSAFWQK
jgi:hypothetical protein